VKIAYSRNFIALALTAVIAVSGFSSRVEAQEFAKLNRLVQSSNSGDDGSTAFREARGYIKDGEWQKAEQTFRSFITKHPQHKDADAALYYLAFALKKENRLAEANKTLEQLIAEHPSSSWINDARAMRIEMAPKLNNNDAINQGIKEEDEEMKLVALQSLFESSPERAIKVATDILKPGSRSSITLKEGAIMLLADSDSKEAGVAVLEVARRETDSRLRRKAIAMLGEVKAPGVMELLKELVMTSSDREMVRAAISAIAEHDGEQSRIVLLELARSAADPELRSMAISELADHHDKSTFDDLIKLFESEKNEEVRKHIISALAESDDAHARAKIMELARSAADIEIRKTAISHIAEHEDEQAANALVELYDAERNQEIKEEIIAALGDMKNKRALRKLMEIVKSDAPVRLKKRAIEALSESGDPEALKFIEELLKKGD
jgi:HEAT repeat protein